jgi:cytochrome d ubiquinol oxidase subunit I
VNALLLARWQFGITTVYHFLFVPLTIGTAFLTAVLQTVWLVKGEERYLRATKFWGNLFLINFALGVATGIVQEFQFGMAWSNYSRFVGDIFGAPLAIEGLLAFFLESTFLGLWIFGWDRLPRPVHTACIWIAAIGTALSAYFILAANAWMQHPVGYVLDPLRHVARLTSIWAVLGNSTAVIAFAHTITAAFLISGMLLVAGSAWHLRRGRHRDTMLPSMSIGLWATLIGGVGTALSGDIDGKIMTDQQPMKMAAAEALYHTSQPAPALLPGHRLVHRPGGRDRRRPGARGGAVRARVVSPDHPGDVLVLPFHDRLRAAGRADRAHRALVYAAQDRLG